MFQEHPNAFTSVLWPMSDIMDPRNDKTCVVCGATRAGTDFINPISLNIQERNLTFTIIVAL